MKIIAIDPGSEQSAYVIFDGKRILNMGILKNTKIFLMLSANSDIETLVIEQIRSYGMAVGMSIFDTVFWSGRFYQAWHGQCHMIPRLEVKQHICHDSRAKGSNIRQALIDRFEPDLKPRCRPKGILKGLKTHLWAAFALAITFHDKEVKP